MRVVRSDWSLASIDTKLKQLRRGAPDQSLPLTRRRTSEVVADTETAVNEGPRTDFEFALEQLTDTVTLNAVAGVA